MARVRRRRTSDKLPTRRKFLPLLFALSLAAVAFSWRKANQLAWKLELNVDYSDDRNSSERRQIEPPSPVTSSSDVTTCTALDCHDGGTCLVNRCICVDPSRTGPVCDRHNPSHNPNSIACLKGNDDRCMNTKPYGRLKVISSGTQERITASRKCEISWWEEVSGEGGGGQPNRNSQQLLAFDYFRALPPNLGHVLEVGAGPYTKIRLILQQQQHPIRRTVKSITLVDPLIDEYLSNPNITTSFTRHELCVDDDGRQHYCLPTTLHSVTAESFVPDDDDQQRLYDTVILVNTLEHTENAVQILHNCWMLLRDGGILIFGEEYSTPFQLQVADPCHPIRIMKTLFDEYLDLYGSALMAPRTGMDVDGMTHQGVKQSVYAIVRKYD